jgi:hypothetical protein
MNTVNHAADAQSAHNETHRGGELGFLHSLENTGVANWVAGSLWGYPITLSSHGVGMAIVVGLIVMISLRLLGFFPNIPLVAVRRMLPYMWAGFWLNLISGVMLFMADARRFAASPDFLLKITFIVIGVAITWSFDMFLLKPAVAQGGDNAVLPRYARPFAIVSILLWWLAVILSGRLIAYLG